MRTSALVALVAGALACIVALPQPAEAGKPKKPYWAVVAADGDLVRSNGALFVLGDDGTYSVYFGPNVGSCAYSVTTSDGWVGVTGTNYNPELNAVHVYTYDSSTKQPLPMPFHLLVLCPKKP